MVDRKMKELYGILDEISEKKEAKERKCEEYKFYLYITKNLL